MIAEAEKEQILGFVKRGNYHAALNIALSSLNTSRSNSDQIGVNEKLLIIREIVKTLVAECGDNGESRQDQIGSGLCAICGAREDEASLLFGANGAICRSCADKAHSYFSRR